MFNRTKMKIELIIVVVVWDFVVHNEHCYFWCLAGMYHHIEGDWLGPGGCRGLGWKKMCQLYRKIWGSMSSHSNGQESAERTCLFSLLHSWFGLLAQNQVVSPLPPFCSHDCPYVLKTSDTDAFLSTPSFQNPLYPFIHPEDGCSKCLQDMRTNRGHWNL